MSSGQVQSVHLDGKISKIISSIIESGPYILSLYGCHNICKSGAFMAGLRVLLVTNNGCNGLSVQVTRAHDGPGSLDLL